MLNIPLNPQGDRCIDGEVKTCGFIKLKQLQMIDLKKKKHQDYGSRSWDILTLSPSLLIKLVNPMQQITSFPLCSLSVFYWRIIILLKTQTSPSPKFPFLAWVTLQTLHKPDNSPTASHELFSQLLFSLHNYYEPPKVLNAGVSKAFRSCHSYSIQRWKGTFMTAIWTHIC